jgi:hypothetical protein
VERIKTHVLYLGTFSENPIFQEIIRENMAEPGKPQIIIRHRNDVTIQTHTRNI